MLPESFRHRLQSPHRPLPYRDRPASPRGLRRYPAPVPVYAPGNRTENVFPYLESKEAFPALPSSGLQRNRDYSLSLKGNTGSAPDIVYFRWRGTDASVRSRFPHARHSRGFSLPLFQTQSLCDRPAYRLSPAPSCFPSFYSMPPRPPDNGLRSTAHGFPPGICISCQEPRL